jgi:type VI secretion system protein ImpL
MKLKLNLMRWIASLVGVQMLCGIVWVLGPLLAPLESQVARLVVLIGVLLLWAAGNLLLDWRRSRQDTELAQGIAGAASEEAAAVGAKLATALAQLREVKGHRGYLYEQPWYAIIGPPGSGKTTALLNAGLKFPLSNEIGPGAVAGVGGTRLCDWWFTEDAVLIDTAGRYTTQDSDATVDKAGWDAFLSLLRKTRPKQPLNGVIVAIGMDDVATDNTAVLDTHARTIRARIDELETRLGRHMPVYVVFTKADLLSGFTEFFADLDRAGREQIWGTTLPLGAPADVAAGLKPLLERLNRRVYQRLDAELDPDRRAAIAGFPSQVASVLPRLQAFVAQAFAPDAAGKAPMLRGAYLTSGTQEGTPIDRLIGSLSRSFGLDQRRAARLRPEAGRSYFLASLLRDTVFREAMLVSRKPGSDKRRKQLRIAGFATCILLALGGAGGLWAERASSQIAVERAEQMLAERQKLAVGLPLNPVSDADFARIVPWLDAASQPPEPAGRDPVGLAQDGKLAAMHANYYRHALEFALFPRLVWRAETRLRGALSDPDSLYDATRVYLMLGGAGPLDPGSLKDWFVRDWAAAYPSTDQMALRAALGRHLDALVREPLPTIALDGPLVAQARAVVGRVPLAQRAYTRLKQAASAHPPPAWRPSDALGLAGAQLFGRLSGRGLDDGVSGLFTPAGFRDSILPVLPRIARDTADEGWVLGESLPADSPARRSLEADVAVLYAAEYTTVWDGLFADLDPLPPRNLTQAAQDLFILASAYSPIRKVLVSAAAQLAPSVAAPPGPATEAIRAVDQRYQLLRGVVGEGGAAPIDLVLRPLSNLQQQLAKQAASTTRAAASDAGQDPAAALKMESVRQPQPLARWLITLATGGAALRDGGPRGATIAAWNAGGGPAALCQTVTGNRYPFAPGASSDVPVDDFTRLLGPGGAIDAFFNTQLKPYVDTSARPWKAKTVDNVAPPVTPENLAQFQRAAAIRDLFFPNGSPQPLVRFDLTPAETGSGVLEYGGAKIVSARGVQPRPAALSWPAATPARLTIAGTQPLEDPGPWSLFRLIGRAQAVTAGDKTTLQYGAGEQSARFELRANPNPFASPLLAEFRCPAVQ